MKKICILQNSLSYGGTDTFIINLCNGLVKDKYDVTVVLSMDKKDIHPRLKDLESTGVNIVWTCSLNGIKAKLKHLMLLYQELKKNKYDVFQANIDLFNGPNMFVSWLAKVPIRECHSHNSQQSKELQTGKTIGIKIYQKVMRFLCWNFSNRRCGCSKEALNFLFEDKWLEDFNARVIHNGIDISLYQGKTNIETKKKELGLKNKYHICTVGRLSYQKNPEFLLDVFYKLTKFRKDVDLIWCGTGDLLNDIQKQITSLNLEERVHLMGERKDVNEILQCSDLFFLPSRFEGLGIVLIEAQAANLLCITSDVVPLEVDCGLCIKLSLDKGSEYWAMKINEALDNPNVLKIDENKLNEYGIHHMIKEMEEVFE